MANLSKDQIKQIIAGRPKGSSPEGIIATLREQGHTLEAYPVQSHLRANRKRQEILAGRAQAEAESQQAGADAWRGVVDTIPEVGSTLGSLAGPRGAAIGAGAGEALRQGALSAVGEGFDKAAIGKRAGFAYAGGKAGQLLGKGLGKVGGVITGSLRRKAVEKAAEEYAAATTAGVTVPTSDLTNGLARLTQRAGAAGQREVDHVLEAARNFMVNKPTELTPIELHEIRQVHDEIAKPYYNKLGKLLKPDDPAIAARVTFAKQVADNARDALRRLVPNATKYEAQASRAIGARKLIPTATPGSLGSAAARTGVGAAVGGMLGGAHGAGVGGLSAALLTQPQVIMALGKLLENPALTPLLSQAGRQAGTTFSQ